MFGGAAQPLPPVAVVVDSLAAGPNLMAAADGQAAFVSPVAVDSGCSSNVLAGNKAAHPLPPVAGSFAAGLSMLAAADAQAAHPLPPVVVVAGSLVAVARALADGVGEAVHPLPQVAVVAVSHHWALQHVLQPALLLAEDFANVHTLGHCIWSHAWQGNKLGQCTTCPKTLAWWFIKSMYRAPAHCLMVQAHSKNEVPKNKTNTCSYFAPSVQPHFLHWCLQVAGSEAIEVMETELGGTLVLVVAPADPRRGIACPCQRRMTSSPEMHHPFAMTPPTLINTSCLYSSKVLQTTCHQVS